MGRELQAAFLELVRRADPSLARELHDGDMLRAYSLALLLEPVRRIVRRATGSSSGSCLDDRVTSALVRSLDPGRSSFELAGSRYTIDGIAPERDDDQLGPVAPSRADLANLADECAADRTVRFEFASPTTFRQGHRDEPLPVPDLVFGGLARRWNAAADGDQACRRMCFARSFANASSWSATTAIRRSPTSATASSDGFVGRVDFRLLAMTGSRLGGVARVVVSPSGRSGLLLGSRAPHVTRSRVLRKL